MNASSFTVRLLLLLSLPLSLAAQALPEGARVSWDRCLGYEMDYKKYPKPVIAKVQADMYQLYHLEPAWQNDAARTGKPLNDGILGPITWSWMQRFCKSVALDTSGNAVAAFPRRATEIATFSTNFSDDARTLLSDPFREWVATHRTTCELDARKILAQGSDTELQALLRCYRQPATAPAVVQEEKIVEPRPSQHTLYVLRADDFEVMAGAVSMSSAVGDAINKVAGKHYPDKATAQAELTALLAALPPEESKNIIDKLSAKLQEKTRYEINDEVLNSLSQQGISDALFNELKKLLGKTFDDQAAFTDTINIAINKSLSEKTSPPTITATASEAETTGNTAAVSASDQVVLAAKPNPAKLLLQIQLASQETYVELDKATATAMASPEKPATAVIIKLLKSMQDIEYPSAELIRLAIKNKVLKASAVCKLDKSNTIDTQLGALNEDESKVLFEQVSKHFALKPGDEKKYCNEDHNSKLASYYNNLLKPIIEPLYSEPMPNYAGKPILWNGGEKTCGCVPAEIQTMAYGIYPYWKTGKEAQVFDFSTFSRVAYFGLTATNVGKLTQINALAGAPTLIADNSDNAKAFIREARRYGSKVDWVIEKEFALAPALNDEAALKVFFDNLKSEVLELLQRPLDDPESHLRPLLSLGLAAQPTNGDGVTFYFKNYPAEQIAKDRFEKFFAELKAELTRVDAERDRFHAVKNHTYINIMVTQSEFLDHQAAFGSSSLKAWTKVSNFADDNLSIPEIQEQVKSMIVLLLEDPYYSALDEIYAVTNSTDRTIIAPLMFTDYSGMNVDAVNNASAQQIDERQKRLSYIHESFGGGGFWPMVEYQNSSDGKDYSAFNAYIGKRFSPGYTESLWNKTLCGYRWALIAIMNFLLLLALIYLISIFYIYPHRCKELPSYIRWLQHPLTVVTILLPPIVLWVYLIVADTLFNIINLSSLLGLVVLVLAIWAGIDAVKDLKKVKPNRNLLQNQKKKSVPRRMPETNNTSDSNELDDDEYK